MNEVDVHEQVAAPPREVRTFRLHGSKNLLPCALAAQDALSIYIAFVLAYWARLHVNVGPSLQSTLSFSEYQRVAIPLLIIMMATLVAKGAYRRQLRMEIVHELMMVVSTSTISVAIIIVITFMFHEVDFSRGVIVYLWVLLLVLMSMTRVLFRTVQIVCHRHGWGVRRLLVIGASDIGKMIMQGVTNRPDLGYRVVGFVDRRSGLRVPDFGRFHRVGEISDLTEVIERENIDDVVMALPGSAHEEAWKIVQVCAESRVSLKLVPDMFQVSLSQVRIDDIGGIPLLHVQEAPLQRLERIAKRSMDLLVGCALSLASLPLIAVLALLIILDSPGPILVRQERMGKDGKRFSCCKLRTMRKDADRMLIALEALNEAQGPIFKIRNDPRLTRIGRYMRRLSLDELPQIWNVVRGDMSLVGPRPPLPREVVKYEPWQMRRLETTPGMTGLWQVSGRSNLSFDEMVMLDIMYVDNWSLALDLKILAKTFLAVLTARGAY